jgi:hypothetical protein
VSQAIFIDGAAEADFQVNAPRFGHRVEQIAGLIQGAERSPHYPPLSAMQACSGSPFLPVRAKDRLRFLRVVGVEGTDRAVHRIRCFAHLTVLS